MRRGHGGNDIIHQPQSLADGGQENWEDAGIREDAKKGVLSTTGYLRPLTSRHTAYRVDRLCACTS